LVENEDITESMCCDRERQPWLVPSGTSQEQILCRLRLNRTTKTVQMPLYTQREKMCSMLQTERFENWILF